MKKVICGAVGIALLLLAIVSFLPKKNDVPYLTIYGPIKSGNGLGQQSIGVFRMLASDLAIHYVPTRLPEEKIPRDLRPFVRIQASNDSEIHLFEEALWYHNSPHWFYDFIAKMPKDKIKIAYSMFESSRIPHEWVLILNCYFDAIAVPDRFLIDVYRKSGVQIPIFEVPLAINLKAFLDQPLKKKNLSRSLMVFANFSTCTDRKNQLTLVKAFGKAFPNRDDVILKINCTEADPEVRKLIEEEIEELEIENVLFTHKSFDDQEYLSVFKSIDCYISCSKGEGFSIQPREAMALGIPVIVTDNTAQSTICKTGLVKSVSSTISEPAYLHCFRKVPYGEFTGCSVDELAAALLDVYNNYGTYLGQGAEARKWVAQYDYASMKQFYLSLVKPKKVLLGSENKVTEEYLMTDSQELYEKYLNLSLAQ